MRTFLMSAALVTALAAPVAVQAEQPAPSATDMKGPPNTNGYSKDQNGGQVKHGENADTPSANDMKGSPNANGYHQGK